MELREIGPIQMIAVGFEKPEFKGEIAAELDRLRERGDIRLVDALAVIKGEDGTFAALEASDWTAEDKMQLGAVIGGLIGYGAAGDQGVEAGALAGAMLIGDEWEYGVDAEGLDSIAEDLPPGGAALFLLIEHRWALGLKHAVRDAGGIVVAQDFLSPEALIGVGAALAAAAGSDES
jgi:uncharacterized membrane protein